MATGNGSTAQPQPQAQAAGPQLSVLAQYIKDFSFENPNAPRTTVPPGQEPVITVPVNVSAERLQDGNVEVVLKIEGKAAVGGTILFNFELSYGGLFQIQGVPTESLQPIIMIECPRLLFPFAREIIATSVNHGGFPPLLLNPPDFVAMFRQNLAQTQPGAPPAVNA